MHWKISYNENVLDKEITIKCIGKQISIKMNWKLNYYENVLDKEITIKMHCKFGSSTLNFGHLSRTETLPYYQYRF